MLSRSPEVVRLENPGVEPTLLETATMGHEGPHVYEQTGGLDLRVRDNDGDDVDGAGVGIAIVDSGIDATHPDLRWAGFGEPDPKTIKNFKVECTTPVLVNTATGQCFGPVIMQDVPDSDTTSGHGTHVAGISAGDGTAGDSDGDPSTTGDRMFRGVAPGAKLFGFGAGEGLSILIVNAAAAFQWIYDNGLSQNPPIRVVNNSWGGAGPHNPGEVMSKLSNALIHDRGITVVFSAGNADGDGSATNTNRLANNPTPGLISVANYDDAEMGSRSNQLDDSSSRGLAADPGTWPDVSAPGTFITSTCKIITVVCPLGTTQTAYPPNYSAVSGTSMAAPHTAGALEGVERVETTPVGAGRLDARGPLHPLLQLLVDRVDADDFLCSEIEAPHAVGVRVHRRHVLDDEEAPAVGREGLGDVVPLEFDGPRFGGLLIDDHDRGRRAPARISGGVRRRRSERHEAAVRGRDLDLELPRDVARPELITGEDVEADDLRLVAVSDPLDNGRPVGRGHGVGKADRRPSRQRVHERDPPGAPEEQGVLGERYRRFLRRQSRAPHERQHGDGDQGGELPPHRILLLGRTDALDGAGSVSFTPVTSQSGRRSPRPRPRRDVQS